MVDINVPDNIKRTLKKLSENGSFAYVMGKSLYDCINDIPVESWTIETNAGKAAAVKMGLAADKDVKIRFFEGSIDDFLDEKLTVIETVGFDGETLFDPYEGINDIRDRVIRLLYDPDEAFEADPGFMLDVIQQAADTGFLLSSRLMRALRENAHLLGDIDKPERIKIFERLMVSRHPGMALRVLEESGLISLFIGKALYETRNVREKTALKKYMECIDSTEPIADRRIAAYFILFWGNRDIQAVKYLYTEGLMVDKVIFAHKRISDVNYASNIKKLKKFIDTYGMEAYLFIDGVSKIQSRVLNINAAVVKRREMLLDKICLA